MAPGHYLPAAAEANDATGNLPVQVAPFEAASLRSSSALDPANCTYVELLTSHQLWDPVMHWVVSHRTPAKAAGVFDDVESSVSQSFSVHVKRVVEAPGSKSPPADAWDVQLGLGLGLFEFTWQEHRLYALHQRVGTIGKSRSGPTFFTSLVLLAAGRGQEELLRKFLAHVNAQSQGKVKPNTYTLYQWRVNCGYWRSNGQVPARKLSSVMLPAKVKQELLDDISDFLAPSTHDFYSGHGIPYRRSYLFYGLPGTGKTSLLQAIAGDFNRNLCFLQPTHPNMTDDGLRSAIEQVPPKSIVVLEDIDAIFTKRDAKDAKSCPLTFSGLLNALDGVGPSHGTIFVLTTNHRERLDPALIRHGRVDVHVEFTAMTEEQTGQMFLSFYPSATPELAARFSADLHKALGERQLAAASLQHFFVVKRKASAEEAAAAAAEVADMIDAHMVPDKDAASEKSKESEQEKDKKEKDKKEKGKGEEKPEEGSSKAKKEGNKDGTGANASPAVHIHLHGIAAHSQTEN